MSTGGEKEIIITELDLTDLQTSTTFSLNGLLIELQATLITMLKKYFHEMQPKKHPN